MRIVTIDGGGIRGVFAAHVLNRIEETNSLIIKNNIDLIVGTSTGSIIAAAVACGIKLEDVVNFYREQGPKIFRRRKWKLGLFNAMYPNEPLQRVVSEVFGDRTMSDVEVPLIIPATDIANGTVHVFKSPYHPSFVRDGKVKIADAVLASCSAPLYFKPSQVGEYLLADGGLWANNPAVVAITDAVARFHVPLEAIHLLSIGTGSGRDYYSFTERDGGWGFLTTWKRSKLVLMLLNLQSATSNNTARLLLDDDRYLRIDFDSDAPLPLDDPTAIQNLISRADRTFTHESEKIRRWWESSVRFSQKPDRCEPSQS